MDQIIGAVIFLLIIVAQIIKSIREAAPPKQPEALPKRSDASVVGTRPKAGRQPPKQSVKPSKTNRQPLSAPQPLQSSRSVFNNTKPETSRQKALVKRLAPQGEGQRFEADPGTLDTGRILASTIDPTVKPELNSMTGIYDQGAVFTDSQGSVVPINLADCLAKPEGIIQAVILAEVLNRPAWKEPMRY